ncbi:hypothetical protein ANTQUA_LOCUS8105 [Anthophora quadrimaculata]
MHSCVVATAAFARKRDERQRKREGPDQDGKGEEKSSPRVHRLLYPSFFLFIFPPGQKDRQVARPLRS